MTDTHSGIVFHLDSSDLKSVVKGHQGTATLVAKVDDVDLWEDVLRNFDGLHLHRGNDFKTELIEVLQGQNEELEQQAASTAEEAETRIQLAEQMASIEREARVKAEQQVRILTAKVEALETQIARWESTVD